MLEIGEGHADAVRLKFERSFASSLDALAIAQKEKHPDDRFLDGVRRIAATLRGLQMQQRHSHMQMVDHAQLRAALIDAEQLVQREQKKHARTQRLADAKREWRERLVKARQEAKTSASAAEDAISRLDAYHAELPAFVAHAAKSDGQASLDGDDRQQLQYTLANMLTQFRDELKQAAKELQQEEGQRKAREEKLARAATLSKGREEREEACKMEQQREEQQQLERALRESMAAAALEAETKAAKAEAEAKATEEARAARAAAQTVAAAALAAVAAAEAKAAKAAAAKAAKAAAKAKMSEEARVAEAEANAGVQALFAKAEAEVAATVATGRGGRGGRGRGGRGRGGAVTASQPTPSQSALPPPASSGALRHSHVPGRHVYPYAELQEAAGGWSEDRKLGSGGSGVVYRGQLASGAPQMSTSAPLAPPLHARGVPCLEARLGLVH